MMMKRCFNEETRPARNYRGILNMRWKRNNVKGTMLASRCFDYNYAFTISISYGRCKSRNFIRKILAKHIQISFKNDISLNNQIEENNLDHS